jgi:Mn2+/Fe2+ NRAMP family transporter
VLAIVLMPPALISLLMMANDRDLMGTRVNRWATNALGILITLLVTLAGAGYAVVAFVNSFGG